MSVDNKPEGGPTDEPRDQLKTERVDVRKNDKDADAVSQHLLAMDFSFAFLEAFYKHADYAGYTPMQVSIALMDALAKTMSVVEGKLKTRKIMNACTNDLNTFDPEDMRARVQAALGGVLH